MIRITNALFTTAALVALGTTAQAATLHTESFESDPGVGYSISTAFEAATFEFFDRYAVPDISNGARDDFLNGWDGSFGLLGQNFGGNDGPGSPITVDIPGVNIAGASNLALTIALAANQSEPDFQNYEAADGDGIEIFANIDGGGQTLIAAFKPNSTGDSDLYQDVDLNGVGEGAVLTQDLVDFTVPISGAGNLLDLSISLTSSGGFEMLVLDNVRVIDIPEPSTGLLLLMGTVAMLARRRKVV